MPTLTCQIDPRLKARFADEARRQGLREAELLRRAVLAVLSNPGDKPTITQGAGTTARMSIRVAAQVKDFVRTSAQANGVSGSTWVAQLVTAKAQERPLLPKGVIDELVEHNRQLRALGRNLNQIVRALHAGYGYQADQTLLSALFSAVGRSQQTVADLLG